MPICQGWRSPWPWYVPETGQTPQDERPAYVGRFAPSPTGPLHAGSLVAALASWLDARAHRGLWLVRIEDIDHTRCRPGMDRVILQQLAACGLHSDQPPMYQSQRLDCYQQALAPLVATGRAYPCACSRTDIAVALGLQEGHDAASPQQTLIYPGTCRTGLQGRSARAWRLNTCMSAPHDPAMQGHDSVVCWTDRSLGPQRQNVSTEVGDFVLKRADGCFAYQLAVVTDDAAQGVTDVVRGQDLVCNTARQILLQRALHLPALRYLHTPLVLGVNGKKLSKQNGAMALDLSAPAEALNNAAVVLGLPPQLGTVTEMLQAWVHHWRCGVT